MSTHALLSHPLLLPTLRSIAAATMPFQQFMIVAPSSRGLSLALTRHLLRTSTLPVFATHRSESPDKLKDHILEPLKGVDPSRLQLLYLELTKEATIASAADALSEHLHAHTQRRGSSNADSGSSANAVPRIHTAFFTGGVLHPEKQPADLDLEKITNSFQINVISHLLLIKHFSRFLPPAARPGTDKGSSNRLEKPAKWVHVSARLGSIGENKRGGWYSYRASKAALNQVVKTFDLHLEMNRSQAICVGVHPGTVKTDLSREFWNSPNVENLSEPEEAAQSLVDVVSNLDYEQRGKIWDWAGKQVPL